jgi:hypothetical protein
VTVICCICLLSIHILGTACPASTPPPPPCSLVSGITHTWDDRIAFFYSPIPCAPPPTTPHQLTCCTPLHPPPLPHTPTTRLRPAQAWGLLWGYAALAHAPPPPWTTAWLARGLELLPSFTAEGMAHVLWGLAALGVTPERLWLRAAVGVIGYNIR